MRRVVEAATLFRNFTSLETSSLSARSLKLFTLSNLHQAAAEFLGRPAADALGARKQALARDVWRTVITQMPDWQAVERRNVAASELRRFRPEVWS